MEIQYFPDTDTLSIRLNDAPSTESEDTAPDVVVVGLSLLADDTVHDCFPVLKPDRDLMKTKGHRYLADA